MLADRRTVVGERATAFAKGLVQLSQILEVAVGHRFVGQRPETFGWLQLRRGGRQEGEVDTLGDLELMADMPACLVEDEDDLLALTDCRGLGEGLKRQAKDRGVDRRQDEPERLAIGGPDEAVEVEPLVAGFDLGDRALALGGPDPTQDGLEPEALLVLGPDLDAVIGVGFADIRDNACQAPFRNAS